MGFGIGLGLGPELQLRSRFGFGFGFGLRFGLRVRVRARAHLGGSNEELSARVGAQRRGRWWAEVGREYPGPQRGLVHAQPPLDAAVGTVATLRRTAAGAATATAAATGATAAAGAEGAAGTTGFAAVLPPCDRWVERVGRQRR